MSCDICGKNNCERAFHSVQMQQTRDDAINSDKSNLLSEIAALRDELKDCSAAFDRQQEALDRNAEQIAVLCNLLSEAEHHKVVAVAKTDWITEEALLGKMQSEYICTCGIRVTPHKCPTDNDF